MWPRLHRRTDQVWCLLSEITNFTIKKHGYKNRVSASFRIFGEIEQLAASDRFELLARMLEELKKTRQA